MEEKLTESLEDYLEVVYNEIKSKDSVKAVDISRILNVSRASVTEALNKLAQKGFINYERYGSISLTETGSLKAKKIVAMHKELKAFFINLGIKQKEAEDTACKIEHIISPNIKKKIAAFNKYFESHPEFKI